MIVCATSSRKEVKIIKIKQVEKKEIYMQMLLHINEDFDDDLLLDTILILCQKDFWSYKTLSDKVLSLLPQVEDGDFVFVGQGEDHLMIIVMTNS